MVKLLDLFYLRQAGAEKVYAVEAPKGRLEAGIIPVVPHKAVAEVSE